MSEEGTEKVRGGARPSLSPRLRMGDTWRMIVSARMVGLSGLGMPIDKKCECGSFNYL